MLFSSIFHVFLSISFLLSSILCQQLGKNEIENFRYSNNTSNKCDSEDTCGVYFNRNYLDDVYYSGLRKRQIKAKSILCKQKIEYEYMKHFRSIALEEPYPFEMTWYYSHCNITEKNVPNPPNSEGVLHLAKPSSTEEHYSSLTGLYPNEAINPNDLSIAYVMLVHENEDFIIRIIDALDEPMHSFIIHVDTGSNDMHAYLRRTLKHRKNIYILNEGRERISWGGFSIVNATLNCMKYAYFDLKLDFDYMVDISGTHYPIKSNYYIRKLFAIRPSTIYLEGVRLKYQSHLWQQFVECDGSMHRIARLPLARGIHLYVGSAWWAFPRYFIDWILTSSFSRYYIEYGQFVVIADENFFSTLYYNSPYCRNKPVSNLTLQVIHTDKATKSIVLHDKNISTLINEGRCIFLDPMNCGVSPGILNMTHINIIEQSVSLFARKFNPEDSNSMELVDYIDTRRGTYRAAYTNDIRSWDYNLQEREKTHGEKLVMIRAKQPQAQPKTLDSTDIKSSRDIINNNTHATVGITNKIMEQNISTSFCLTFPSDSVGNLVEMGYVTLQPCDSNNEFQWIHIGHCTSDTSISINETNNCLSIKYNKNNSSTVSKSIANTIQKPHCSLYKNNFGHDICMDLYSGNRIPKTGIIAYPCKERGHGITWNQDFFIRDNNDQCSLYVSVPNEIVINHSTLCLESNYNHTGDLYVNTCDISNDINISSSTTNIDALIGITQDYEFIVLDKY